MTNIDYSKFTSEDFLKDTYFLKSIKTPTKESNAFWKEQLLTEKIQEKDDFFVQDDKCVIRIEYKSKLISRDSTNVARTRKNINL